MFDDLSGAPADEEVGTAETVYHPIVSVLILSAATPHSPSCTAAKSCIAGGPHTKTSALVNVECFSSNFDLLPFPKREYFHDYFGKRITSILSSRGCWRNCAFCSINAWYEKSGGNKFRTRSIGNLVEEIRELYFRHDVRIFNFQDDNFFLPDPAKAEARFIDLRDSLKNNGIDIGTIAIAVKSRPESITDATISVLAELGLFRVFLGVENASENGLRNLNRRNKVEHILNALRVLNDYDVHIAFNIVHVFSRLGRTGSPGDDPSFRRHTPWMEPAHVGGSFANETARLAELPSRLKRPDWVEPAHFKLPQELNEIFTEISTTLKKYGY